MPATAQKSKDDIFPVISIFATVLQIYTLGRVIKNFDVVLGVGEVVCNVLRLPG